MNLFIRYFALLCLIWPAVSWADDEPCDTEEIEAQTDCVKAETVVVTAGRCAQSRFEAARAIEVLEREALDEAQVRSVPEALEDVPGVFLQQTNRGAGAPYIRGLVGPQNLILVDGLRFNTSTLRTGPNQVLALLDPFAAERIEVLRGPSSVLYGDGAMGGVIQLLTHRNTLNDVSGSARARYSTADSSSGMALRLASGGRRLAGWAGLHFDHFNPLRAGGGVEQPISDYDLGYWQAKALWAAGEHWSVTGAYLGSLLRDTGRSDQAGRGDIRFYDNDDHLAYLRWSWKRSKASFRQADVSLSYHRLAERVRRNNCATDEDGVVLDLAACFSQAPGQITRIRHYEDVVDVLGADADLRLVFFDERLSLRSGLEFYQEFVASSMKIASASSGFVFEKAARGNFSDGSRYQTMGLFLYMDGLLLDFGSEVGRLKLSGGARLSRFAAFAPGVPDLGDVDYDYQGLVGSVGLQWLRPGIYNLYLSFVQGFRAPNLQETTQLGDTGQKFNIPNQDLRPEVSNTLELGGRANLGPVTLGLAGFYALGEDAIMWQAATYQGQSEVEGKPVAQLINALASESYGVEGSLTWRLARVLLKASMTWMRSDVEHEDGSWTPARRIPPLFASLSASYREADGRFHVGLFMRLAAAQDRLHPQDEMDARICETAPYSGELSIDCAGSPAWMTLGLRAGYRVSQAIMLRLNLSNFTDSRYRTHGSGFDAPGMDLRLSLDARF